MLLILRKDVREILRLVDNRLSVNREEDVVNIWWSCYNIFRSVSPIGQRFVKGLTVSPQSSIIIEK